MSGFELSAFADEISPSLDTQIRVLTRQQIRFMELRSAEGSNVSDFTLEQAKDIQARLTAAGIGVSSIGSPIGKISITDDFDAHFEKFKHVCALAHIFNTKNIRVFSFYMPEGEDPAIYREEVISRLKKMIAYARQEGLCLLHENEKFIYGDTAERCLDLMQTLFCESFKFTYDFSNFVQCGQKNFPDTFEKLRPYIAYIHMKDSVYDNSGMKKDIGFDKAVVSDAHRPVGEGDGDVVVILRALRKAGFEGFLSIEPHLSNNSLCGQDGEDIFAVAAYAARRSIHAALF